MVEHHDVGASADFPQVPERSRLRADRTAVHAGPDAIGSTRGAGRPVVHLPHFGAPRVAPDDPFAVGAIVPVRPVRQRLPRRVLEFRSAVLAVTDALPAQTGPAVIGKSVRAGSLDDLAKDRGQVFVVVRTVDTGDVPVGG